MSAKHTPGPWASIVPPSSCLATRFIEGPNGEHIAKIGHMDYSSGGIYSDLANARLIAAAPELLEALKGMVALYEAMHAAKPFVDSRPGRALEAIAKAEGRE